MLNCVNCSAAVTEEETKCPACGRNPRVKVVTLEESVPARPKSRPVRRWPKYVAAVAAVLLIVAVVTVVDEITGDSSDSGTRTLSSSDGVVSLVVPETWRETSVVPGADVEASDSDAAEYVAAFVLEKKDGARNLSLDRLLEGSAATVLREFGSGDLVGDPEDLDVGGYPAIQQRLHGSIQGEGQAVMLITIVDTEDAYVFVGAWTRPGNFLRALPRFDTILERMRITDEPINA